VLLEDALVGGDDGIVLIDVAGLRGGHGAGGDPDGRGAHAVHPLDGGRIGGGGAGFEIVLEVAAGAYAVLGRAQGEEATAHFIGLREDGVDGREHGGKQPSMAEIFRQRFIGDAAVDDGESGADSVDFAEEIGPDFGFGHDDGGWPQSAEDAAEHPDVIDGRVEDAIGDIAEFSSAVARPAMVGSGDEEAAVGKGGAEFAGELQAGQDFADGNCMQPNRTRSGLLK